MGWTRLGRVVQPPGSPAWAASHAMVPFLERDEDGFWLWFTARDAEGRSHTTRVRFSLDDRELQPELPERAVLEPGALGAFDDGGAMGSCVVGDGDRRLLYYIGWNRGVTVPFITAIGCAVSTGGGPFERVSRAPVLGRSDVDPFFATSPWVLRDEGRWRMWYTSCVGWEPRPGRPHHRYHIKYAESADGLTWEPTGRVCIDFADEGEYAIARPCVVRDGDRYRMWFSHRGANYRIGYAESADGLTWSRLPQADLESSGSGFEAEMVEYPFVFDHDGSRYLLYNGDGYGATGIGLARLEE
jgi:hypothetical protein